MEKHPTGEYVLFEDYKWMSDYADRLVEHKDMPCLPADLANLRTANAHFAKENETLKKEIKDLNELFITQRLSKILIFRNNIDNIIEYIYFMLFKENTKI